ncbi:MAG: polysaccharide deacetylase family protein [Clostridiales bacterium]
MVKSNREDYQRRKEKATGSDFHPKSPVAHIENSKEKEEPKFQKNVDDSKIKKQNTHEKAVTKNKAKRLVKRNILMMVLAILFVAAIVVGGYFAYNIWADNNKTAQTITIKSEKEQKHGYFVLGSSSGHIVSTKGDNAVDLKGNAVMRDNQLMAPLDGVAQILKLDVSKEKTGNNVVVSKGKKKLTIIPNTSEVQVGTEVKPLSSVPYYQGENLYVPVSDIANLLGFQKNYTEDTWRLDVFSDESQNHAPVAGFVTSKTNYAIGEKIEYAMAVGDSDGDSIVEYKWKNRQEKYFTAGNYDISLMVKDSRGLWSTAVTKKITISGAPYVGAVKIPILMYHYIAEKDDDVSSAGKYYGNDAIMGIGQFKRQMEYLKNNGYNTLLVSDFISYIDCDVLPPEKSVVLIFDDGYENNYTLAFPILKQLGLKANIAAVLSDSVKKSDIPNYNDSHLPHLSFAQLKEMQDSGYIEIGSHTYDGHVAEGNYSSDVGYFLIRPAMRNDLGRAESESEYVNRVKDDFMQSKTILKERLGIDNPFFVYPYGRLNSLLEKTAKDMGYSAAFVIRNQYVTKANNRFQLTRFGIGPKMTDEEYISIISGQKIS